MPSHKHILFFVPHFNVGGMIVSLQSLLYELSAKDIKVDIFALDRSGVYIDKLPNCRILPEEVWLSSRLHSDNIIKRAFHFFIRFLRKVSPLIGLNVDKFFIKLGGNKINTIDYDAVISFQENLTEKVCYVPAKKRIAWIHCDYSRYKNLFPKNEESFFSLFDTVVCVSEFTRKVFCDLVNISPEKVVCVRNCINFRQILRRSEEGKDLDPMFDAKSYTIVSIGRLDPVKRFNVIPDIAASISKRCNIQFKWYIIGGKRGHTEEENIINAKILRNGVAEKIHVLSEKDNIYPYLKLSDLYVCTSLSEAYPMAINEAKVLGIPIISANFGSASEVVNEGSDGYILPVEAMADKIIALMEGKLNKLTKVPIEVFSTNNAVEVEKFLNLI